MKYIEKKGLSPIIATVMIIMITVAAAALIMAFVIPFITEKTSSAGECFEVSMQGLAFADTSYNCYTEAAEEICRMNDDNACKYDHDNDGNSSNLVGCQARTGFSIKVDKEGAIGVRVSLISGGSSVVYDILNDEGGDEEQATKDNVREWHGTNTSVQNDNFGNDLPFPDTTGMMTYIVKGEYETIKIAPLVKSDTKNTPCDVVDTIHVASCVGGIEYNNELNWDNAECTL